VLQPGDAADYHLVFACTDRADVNAQVAREARAHGAWCNVADNADASDFHSAAAVRRGEICIGIGTAGGSPALARHLRERVEACIGPEYEQLLDIMSRQRAFAKATVAEPSERASLWRAVLASDALDLLRDGRRDEAEALVARLVTGSDT
jgi:siroheme synthase-like protein